MLVLTRADVEQLLDLDELVGALARAHAEYSEGAASMPSRIAAIAGADGLLGAMPGHLPSAGLGCKLVSVFPHNVGRPSHQAVIVLFDPANGSPLALMDGTYITATRTAAAAALATRLLARADAQVLAILGTGVQARSHARAFAGIREWREIRVGGRDPAKTAELAAELGARACSFEEAVRGADVVAAATHSPDPVVRLDWLEPGAHVTSVGFSPPGSELDPELVRAATIAVESRDSAFAPGPGGAAELAGIDRGSVVELGELVAGTRPGRTTPSEITLYKSVGIAVQDLAAAALVLGAARERDAGLEIELEEIHA
jgi:ornithine cyclodeaminase/alanine dehydrogenase-like protein (mu-crystallin family)